jgi:hypothetical protein
MMDWGPEDSLQSDWKKRVCHQTDAGTEQREALGDGKKSAR